MKGFHPLDLKMIRSIAPLVFAHVQKMDSGFSASEGLSDEEADFFRTNGFLVKHGVVPEELTTRAIDYTWSMLPEEFDPLRPRSWRGEVEDCLCTKSISDRRGRVKFRERVRREQWLHAMIDQNPCIRATVEGLLGADRTPKLPYVRGLYPVIPCKARRRKKPRPHTDGHRFFVGTLTYLADVVSGGGGFHVWPGSHLIMRDCFETTAGSGWRGDYHRKLYDLAKTTPPMEIVAPRGSVVFWHHRLAHAAGINRSNQVRHAALADYPPTDYERIHAEPVDANPWKHWSPNLN